MGATADAEDTLKIMPLGAGSEVGRSAIVVKYRVRAGGQGLGQGLGRAGGRVCVCLYARAQEGG